MPPQTTLLKFWLVLFVVILTSFYLPESALGQRGRSRNKTKPDVKPVENLSARPSIVADASLWQLPRKYVGDDAGSLFQKLVAQRAGAEGNAARGMKKLIEQGERLRGKVKGK